MNPRGGCMNPPIIKLSAWAKRMGIIRQPGDGLKKENNINSVHAIMD
ncbi:MAG: hypothetical protein ACXQTW_07955 [Candidatus Methanospirareceae archaeon]